MAKNPTTEVSGLLGGSTSPLTGQLTTITSQLQELQTINQAQMQSIEANTSALGASTSSKSGGTSTAGSVGNTLLDVLGLGSGLSPLISGLVSLFGGGGGGQTTTVTPYIQPLPVNLAAGFTGSAAGGASGVDYGEGGQPRQTTAASAQQQITVQVQAMDSQSFLDRSNDIAAAVRKAMLETSTLNDVIRGV
jgi:tetrahydromethanopterin S-methyltransferase subunit B